MLIKTYQNNWYEALFNLKSHNREENFEATPHIFVAWQLESQKRNSSNGRMSASAIASITRKSTTAATKARSKFAVTSTRFS